jgi:hypothetical protein
MRCLLIALMFAAAPALGQDEPLQQAFEKAMQRLEAGDAASAESALREILKSTDAPRVKLELARALYVQGKYAEAKALFQEVAAQGDTPWRVRDNIAHFVRDIEERAGYLKFGFTVIADSNPRSLAEQKEFAIGGLRVTPTEAPKKLYGLRYSARGWLLIEPLGGAAFFSAAYSDYPGEDVDRMTLDFGAVKNLTESGTVRLKPGMEIGTFGGQRLYRFPYLATDAVLAQMPGARVTAELKGGKVSFRDFAYLDATHASVAVSARKLVSADSALSVSTAFERSSAKERPYSYYGWDAGPGVDTFWPQWTMKVAARVSVGARKYADTDPLFGEQRVDRKQKLELTLGNKRWRWRTSDVSLVAALERNNSNIGFYSYRKSNVSIVIE